MRLLVRIACLPACTALMMTSCAAWPQVLGSYADKLTYADLVEIRALVKDRADLRPIFRVWMHSPDRALVESGDPWRPDTVITGFIVYKKGGHWNIDETSIEKERPLVTGGFTPNQALELTATRRTEGLKMNYESGS